MNVLGVLGGTFDPIHNGHLGFAADAMRVLGLREVLLVPAGRPPHRAPPVASAADRLAMTRLGSADTPGLLVDDREIARDAPSYTVDTLESLRHEAPDRPLALLLGADAMRGLAGWHQWRRLFSLAHLVVAERPGAPLAVEALEPALRDEWQRRSTAEVSALERAPAGAIVRVPITPRDISSTALRALLARGADARAELGGLLPAAVLAYIDRNQLYRSPDAT
jgi:nicotinate-nucleotide adenylyltransferase